MLSEALRLIRVFHDLKQNDLAERLGVSKSYLSEIESGKKAASLEVIQKYSDEFGIPASSIMFFSERLEGDGEDGKTTEKAKGVIAAKVLNFLRLVEARTERDAEKA